MIARRLTGLLTGLLLVGGCSVPDRSDNEPQPSSSPTTASASEAGQPVQRPQAAPTGLDDPALDLALSQPKEDSVYPQVGDPGVDALHYDLNLAWDPEEEILTGTTTIMVRATKDADHLQLDLAEPLTVSEVRVDGEVTAYDHRGKDLILTAAVTAEDRYTVQITYSGSPQPIPAPSSRQDVPTNGFTVNDAGEVWTMQEPHGAYTWYPVNDQPADKALYDFTISVGSPLVGVANGQQQSRIDEDGQTVTTYHLDEPAASYLITLAIGDYQHETDRTASGVPLNYWVPRRLADTMERVRRTKHAVEWAEEKLGPWPYSSAGTLVVDGQSGMETQTLITLADDPYTLSDEVLVHEMVHHYFGNQVTPSDWRDVWLNEGITTYLQAVYRSETTGESLTSITTKWAQSDQSLRDEAGPPGNYDPRQFAASNVYYSPALMWHELRQRVGNEVFWETMRTWPAQHDNGNAGRRAMVDHVEESTGQELSSFFDEWLLSDITPDRGR